VRIGAGTRQRVLEQSEIIKSRYGVLADAVPLIADPLVRNRGTFGGNVANGDPANDGPAIVIALGAELLARGPQGERGIPANRFYKSLFVTDLKSDEILVEIRIPVPPARSGSAYRKLKRKTGDYAAAAVAVRVSLDAKGALADAGIALTNVAPTPVEAVEAQKYLVGRLPDEKAIAEASRMAAEAASPSADRRGSVEYKREMTRVLCGRALEAALERAKGS
jgi:carbon-monoxide dehydrogenase medium subunit